MLISISFLFNHATSYSISTGLTNFLLFIQSTLLRLSSLRLAVSHTFLYKKLDEYGHNHLHDIQAKIEKEGEGLTTSGPVVRQNSGRKLIIDNFNYLSEPHDMTYDKQNKVFNWVGLMITENRVLASSMKTEKPPLEQLLKLDNGMCLPNHAERNRQRKDYIALCGRVAVQHIKCLKDLRNVSSDHIQHRYSSAMSEPTDTVSFWCYFYFNGY